MPLWTVASTSSDSVRTGQDVTKDHLNQWLSNLSWQQRPFPQTQSCVKPKHVNELGGKPGASHHWSFLILEKAQTPQDSEAPF